MLGRGVTRLGGAASSRRPLALMLAPSVEMPFEASLRLSMHERQLLHHLTVS